jgi:threonine dehydratase
MEASNTGSEGGTPTPLDRAPDALAQAFGDGRELFLKREDVHELGSFKWRGALPTLRTFQTAGAAGVVTASTGNHGAATAWAAARTGLRATVFAPAGASPAKLALIERHGADVVLRGADLDEAKDEARRFAESRALPFFEDGAERAQYDAYGAIADEIFEQLSGESSGDADPAGTEPDVIVVPLGNGALLGGVGIATCRRSPATRRVGVVAAGAPVMAESWEEGRPVETDACDTFADGLAVRVAIPFALDVLGEIASDVVRVSEREIATGVAGYAEAGIRAEGAAGAALAGLRKLGGTGRVVVVVTGRNIDDEVFRRAVERPETFPD